MRIAGSRALITGAGHGLGKAIAAEFLKSGASVIVTDRDTDRVAETIDEFGQGPDRVKGFVLDVTCPDQIAQVRNRLLEEMCPIDVLVNNAGVVFGGAFGEVSFENHRKTVEINLTGLLAVTHAFLPDLIARPAAHIVNIASAAAVVPLPFATSYAATKSGVVGFSSSLREELRVTKNRHVSVTTICPSYITTGLFAGARPARLTYWLTPEEVAHAVRRAVEKKQRLVLLPWTVSLLHATCRGLPSGMYARICRRLGVATSMAAWQGHGSVEPKNT